VDDGGHQPGIGYHLAPLTEGKVARHGHRGLLLLLGLDLEQELDESVHKLGAVAKCAERPYSQAAKPDLKNRWPLPDRRDDGSRPIDRL
jgi:hypothetical protein